ncbi:MAG: PqqD family protein [Clostridiales bacterium]|jgi:hypothetical protein|nr:PqqD family protein [Clostridiales bacterium]
MIKMNLAEVNKDEALAAVPVFDKARLSFRREEKDGYISVNSKYAARLHELFFNKTTQIILEKCDGEKTAGEIAGELLQLFRNVTLDELEKDLLETLLQLYRFQLITWKKEDPFVYTVFEEKDNLAFCSVQESDIREILNFVKENGENADMFKYVHPLATSSVYCDEVFLREVLFNFEEDFYVLKTAGKIRGLISLRFSKSVKSSVSSIGIILCDESNLEFLIKGVINCAADISMRNAAKIKIQIVKEPEAARANIEELLPRLGFELECLLKKEVERKDLAVYSRYI